MTILHCYLLITCLVGSGISILLFSLCSGYIAFVILYSIVLVPLVVAEAVKSTVAIDNIQLDGQSTTITLPRFSILVMLQWSSSAGNSGVVISGALAVSRHLCRLSGLLYAGSPIQKSEVSGTVIYNQLHLSYIT